MKRKLLIFMLASVAIAALAVAQFPLAPGTGPGLAETIEAIGSAGVTTRILYVTAHPDDESAAVLTYLARGLHGGVALLSITRGEGGQNALGPEQAPQLGLIRTQELLAATRGYGVSLFFTRASDFGYSKTPEETMQVWGDQVLEDMVRVIRTFRPHLVINNWGGVRGGHGHHQAAGILTPKAVHLAADANAFRDRPELKMPPPWNGEDQHPVQIVGLERGSEPPKGYVLPLDDVSPLWGKTWRQIGLDAFANHRTQGISGFLGSPFLRRPIALIAEGDSKFDPKSLAEPLRELFSGCRAFAEADDDLVVARSAALHLDWGSTVLSLARAAAQTARWQERCPLHLAGDPWQTAQIADLNRPQKRIERALALAAAIEFTAQADRSELVAGESFTITTRVQCRKEAHGFLGESRLLLPPGMKESKREGDAERGFKITVAVTQAAPPLTNWEELQPEPPPLVSAQLDVIIGDYKFSVNEPVVHIAASSTRVDKVPLRIVPAYTLAIEPRQFVIAEQKLPKQMEVHLRVHSYATKAGKVAVGLDVPKDWQSTPPMELDLAGSEDQLARFTVTPSTNLQPGSYTIGAYAKRGEEKFTTSLEPLPSLPTELWSGPAECKVRAFDVIVPENLRVGYITAEGEPIPEALGRLGIKVELLDAAALAFGDLSKFDAIVVGVRAYELRPDLVRANQRLLDYAAAGGTLVAQYNRDFAWNTRNVAPYPAKIGSPTLRITDENSPVRFLLPDHALLNFPNKITQQDFKGWGQERGLYFWGEFDPRYQAVLAMRDPGEKELNGGLVYTRLGKGVYIYTGIAFFRQLPEGVPGAYRLFVNLLSQSRAKP